MKSNTPLVSVIVVNYNGQQFLKKSLASVQAQTYPALEILCVDNGSADNSVALIRENFPNVHLIPATNRGFGAACNRGVKEARGEYVFFLNEDMHISPSFVQELLDTYQAFQQRDPQIGALGCSQDGYEGQRKMDIYPGKLDLFGYPGPVIPPRKHGGFIPGCAFFIRRELFLESGGFCEQLFLYGDDTDLSWRLLLMGYHHYAEPAIRLFHYDAASMPGFPPRKIYYFIYGTLVPLYLNYSTFFVLFFLALSVLYHLTVISGGLLIFTRGNMHYVRAVWQALGDFLKAIPRLKESRQLAQQKRVISDGEFIRRYVQLRPSHVATRAYRRITKPIIPPRVTSDTTAPP